MSFSKLERLIGGKFEGVLEIILLIITLEIKEKNLKSHEFLMAHPQLEEISCTCKLENLSFVGKLGRILS